MGKVSARIREWIGPQVADRGTVVWHDPDKVHASLAESLIPQPLSARHVSWDPN
jgi:hypothetical protein